ncbi:MAG: transaldolase / glucose-6-phosphate isomerase [Chloroflexota bacterium]|jgi:glucose-6-phosphate isomerase|nr:transaldolase / glucose-6-phosphate isomerase [Chloroflexota bacterium]
MTSERWAERLWSRDGTLWASDPEKAREIAWWAGWLELPQKMLEKSRDFDIARSEMGARYNHVVLCGMGGSSLCPEVLRTTFGRREGFPELIVLDSTDPSSIVAVESRIDLHRTLFLVASKSGGTTETLSHYRYFHQRLRDAGVPHDSKQIVAITDPGSGLQKLAQEQDFGFVFLNPEDVGGRYSALSYFGMVPAALMGLDQAQVLTSARAMGMICREPEAAVNPGLALAAVLGVAAASGRDKCTIICSPKVANLGIWLEQLLAESTGKEGRGIVPVESEPLGAVDAYGSDRLFIYIRSAGADPAQDEAVKALRNAGHPAYNIEVDGPQDLGAEFLRWEIATALAGAVLEINPFDQPNVQESKDNTKAVLRQFSETGDFGVPVAPDPEAEVRALVQQLKAGDYLAILAYTEDSPDVRSTLQELRRLVRDRHGVATTLGFGPRYLHSTGQLHKGGPNTGAYLILSDDRGEELPIPGEGHGFKTLIRAQWLGDLKSLRDHGRRVAQMSLGQDRAAALQKLLEVVSAV